MPPVDAAADILKTVASRPDMSPSDEGDMVLVAAAKRGVAHYIFPASKHLTGRLWEIFDMAAMLVRTEVLKIDQC